MRVSLGLSRRCSSWRRPEAAAEKDSDSQIPLGLNPPAPMRSLMVVFVSVLFAKHFGFQQTGEEFHIQELVSEARVKTLAVCVLLRASRCDKQGFKSSVFYPFLNRFGHELRSIVRSDELRDSTLHDKAVELSPHFLVRRDLPRSRHHREMLQPRPRRSALTRERKRNRPLGVIAFGFPFKI